VWPAVERQAGVEERWGVLGPIVRPFISIPGFFFMSISNILFLIDYSATSEQE
jgi:hypothetical protein